MDGVVSGALPEIAFENSGLWLSLKFFSLAQKMGYIRGTLEIKHCSVEKLDNEPDMVALL